MKAPNKFGLVGKIRAMHEELTNMRDKGFDISLSRALKEERLSSNGIKLGKDLTIGSLMHDLGIDPKRDTVRAVIQMPDDQRWIIPEYFLETIEAGMRQNNDFYQALIAGVVEQATLVFQQPAIGEHSIEGQGHKPDTIGGTPDEGAPLDFSVRSIATEKFSRKIGIPHEVQRYTTLDQLALFMTRRAKVWGLQMVRRALDVAINGDRLDGNNAAGTIGVETASEDLQWIDLTRIHARMNRLGFRPTTVVTSEDNVIHVVNLSEFKNLQQGRSLGEAKVQGTLPSSWSFWMHSAVGANKYLFLDPQFAMQELVSEGLRTTMNRIEERDMSELYVRIQNGFAVVERQARVVVDQSLAYAENNFPAWMVPID